MSEEERQLFKKYLENVNSAIEEDKASREKYMKLEKTESLIDIMEQHYKIELYLTKTMMIKVMNLIESSEINEIKKMKI